MEKKVIIAILLVFGILFSFYFVNLNPSITSYAISDISDESLNTPINSSVIQQDALDSLEVAEGQLQNLKDNDLPIFYIEDIYEEALVIYQQAYYAEIMRGDYSEEEKTLASKELKLVNWRKIDYSDVLIYTNEIDKHFEKIYFIGDSIEIETKKLETYSNKGFEISQESLNILNKTIIAFNNDQLNDAESFLDDYRNSIEDDLSQKSILGSLEKSTKNFIQRYRYVIIFLLVIFIGIALSVYRLYQLRKLEHKIARMKHEKVLLVSLIKKTQDERFNQASIPNLVYNVRMEKYKEKLDEVKRRLPVLEDKYKKMSEFHWKDIFKKKPKKKIVKREYPKESHPKIKPHKIKQSKLKILWSKFSGVFKGKNKAGKIVTKPLVMGKPEVSAHNQKIKNSEIHKEPIREIKEEFNNRKTLIDEETNEKIEFF